MNFSVLIQVTLLSERLGAIGKLASVGLFPSVNPHMLVQVAARDKLGGTESAGESPFASVQHHVPHQIVLPSEGLDAQSTPKFRWG